MTASPPKATPFGEGVYFAARDYASVQTRLLILLVDVAVLWLVWIVLALALPLLSLGYADYSSMVLSWPLVVYLYLVPLKVSPVRTVGFRMAGVKIVTLKGARPSILRMTFRLFLWLFGPFFNVVYDLLWMAGDECRQSIRDKVSGTYVIKNNAVALGVRPIRLVYLFCFGLNLACLEVKRPPP
jgi:uncharacterized RDD family membrane protein YckC